jgi:hypothetical protein
MILRTIERIRRAIWTWRQPLTIKPTDSDSSVSDLFVWRSSEEWQTFFELIDIASLFEENQNPRYVTLVIFNDNGIFIKEKKVILSPNKRQTLDVSAAIGRSHGEVGTFAVFHSAKLSIMTELGSHLAERGYISYLYRDAPIRAYVHGNLDAVAQRSDRSIELLGGCSFFNREYRLQHELQSSDLYELGMVNPTSVRQRCSIKFISIESGKITEENLDLPSGGTKLVALPENQPCSVRVVIQSKFVMGRPLVFRINNHKLDVFHG